MGYIETLTEKIEQAKTRKEKRAYRIAYPNPLIRQGAFAIIRK